MKVSFIATVFNEGKTINSFLRSIFSQSKLPDEIIIVDGGSTDNTTHEISNFKFPTSNTRTRIKLIFKKGNRSVGRNEAIKNANNEIIVCSDAGCILDKDWIKKITQPFSDQKIDVVAGYYRGKPDSIFEKCLIPYVLVMPDQIGSNNFLPASRSMAFTKSIWKKAGGFDEQYSHNEDYVFAHKLKKIGAHIVFEKNAIANWIPRNNLKDTLTMFLRFAFGDSESGILRGKVLLIFARYVLFFYLLLLAAIEKSAVVLYAVGLGLISYIIWSIKKNYKYVQDAKAFFFLPFIQFTSDFAVIAGTSLGLLKKINTDKIYLIIKNNKLVSLIIGVYVLTMILLINWGIPNSNHPFNYFMDEWHQAQAVRAVFSHGSPNIPGSANGSMLHFLLSGLFLMPFIISGIVNPFVIKSSVDAFEMQQRLFQVLRLNTLFFGVLSVILIAYIAKKYFKLNPILISFLFAINPIWITLSNYYKYDIALIFWILLSFLFTLRYSAKPSFISYSLAAFISGLALSVKVSALPLLPILFLSYFLFTKKRRDNIGQLLAGIFIFLLTFLLFGIPDLLLGKGNISEYLYDNLIRTPNYASNYILGTNYIFYLVFKGGSTIFGNILFFLSNIALISVVGHLFKNKFQGIVNKRYLLTVAALLIFIFSLLFLKIEARSNRLLVLLPFMVLLSGIFIHKAFKLTGQYSKKIIIFTLAIILSLQAIESFSWINLKLKADLRQSSSNWIINNIPVGSAIGIENMSIYQFLPDVILKDYYLSERHMLQSARYSYKIIDNSFTKLPPYVIVTNEEIAENYLVKSSKKDLIRFLKDNNYRKIYNLKLNLEQLSLFKNKLDYFMTGLIQEPLSISIYKYP